MTTAMTIPPPVFGPRKNAKTMAVNGNTTGGKNDILSIDTIRPEMVGAVAYERETTNLRAAGITDWTLGDLLDARRTDCDPLTEELLRAAKTITDTEQAVVNLGEWIISRVRDVTEKLAEDSPVMSINGMGELQSTGARYDLACAKLHTAREHLAVLARLWNARKAPAGS
jgi:hypothetical protein